MKNHKKLETPSTYKSLTKIICIIIFILNISYSGNNIKHSPRDITNQSTLRVESLFQKHFQKDSIKKNPYYKNVLIEVKELMYKFLANTLRSENTIENKLYMIENKNFEVEKYIDDCFKNEVLIEASYIEPFFEQLKTQEPRDLLDTMINSQKYNNGFLYDFEYDDSQHCLYVEIIDCKLKNKGCNEVDFRNFRPCEKSRNFVALVIGCITGDLEAVKYLIKKENVNVNSRSDLGSTPLMFSCESRSKNLEVVKCLARNGARADFMNKYNYMPLAYSAHCNEIFDYIFLATEKIYYNTGEQEYKFEIIKQHKSVLEKIALTEKFASTGFDKPMLDDYRRSIKNLYKDCKKNNTLKSYYFSMMSLASLSKKMEEYEFEKEIWQDEIIAKKSDDEQVLRALGDGIKDWYGEYGDRYIELRRNLSDSFPKSRFHKLLFSFVKNEHVSKLRKFCDIKIVTKVERKNAIKKKDKQYIDMFKQLRKNKDYKILDEFLRENVEYIIKLLFETKDKPKITKHLFDKYLLEIMDCMNVFFKKEGESDYRILWSDKNNKHIGNNIKLEKELGEFITFLVRRGFIEECDSKLFKEIVCYKLKEHFRIIDDDFVDQKFPLYNAYIQCKLQRAEMERIDLQELNRNDLDYRDYCKILFKIAEGFDFILKTLRKNFNPGIGICDIIHHYSLYGCCDLLISIINEAIKQGDVDGVKLLVRKYLIGFIYVSDKFHILGHAIHAYYDKRDEKHKNVLKYLFDLGFRDFVVSEPIIPGDSVFFKVYLNEKDYHIRKFHIKEELIFLMKITNGKTHYVRLIDQVQYHRLVCGYEDEFIDEILHFEEKSLEEHNICLEIFTWYKASAGYTLKDNLYQFVFQLSLGVDKIDKLLKQLKIETTKFGILQAILDMNPKLDSEVEKICKKYILEDSGKKLILFNGTKIIKEQNQIKVLQPFFNGDKLLKRYNIEPADIMEQINNLKHEPFTEPIKYLFSSIPFIKQIKEDQIVFNNLLIQIFNKVKNQPFPDSLNKFQNLLTSS